MQFACRHANERVNFVREKMLRLSPQPNGYLWKNVKLGKPEIVPHVYCFHSEELDFVLFPGQNKEMLFASP